MSNHQASGVNFPDVPATKLPWDRVTLSVVIPAYNETATVESLLRRVREVPLKLEVIVVDDGSTDGTRDLLEELEGELIDQLIFYLDAARNYLFELKEIATFFRSPAGKHYVEAQPQLLDEPLDRVRRERRAQRREGQPPRLGVPFGRPDAAALGLEEGVRVDDDRRAHPGGVPGVSALLCCWPPCAPSAAASPPAPGASGRPRSGAAASG